MATRAKGGFGTKLARSTDGINFTTIAEVGDIDGPGKESVIVEATNMDSPDNRTEKIAVGLIDEGDVSFPVHLLDAEPTHQALENDMELAISRTFKITPKGATKAYQFTALVKSIGRSFPLRDKMVRNITLTVTGKVTEVAATGS